MAYGVQVATRHRALDGSTVHIGGVDLDFTVPIAGSIEFTDRLDGNVGFQAGAAGIAHRHLTRGEYPDFTFTEQYEFSGGTLRVGFFVDVGPVLDSERTPPTHVLGEWSGDWHSVFTFARRGVDWDVDVVRLFEQVRIDDSPEGVSIAPLDGLDLTVTAVVLTKEVPGLGVLSIQPVSLAGAMLPSWSGERVTGGEVFISDAPRGSRDSFDTTSDDVFLIFASDTAIATIAPPVDDAPLDARLRRLEALSLRWEQA